jgi:hypothetical protein
MTDIIKYSPEFIFKYKTSNIFTESLRIYLDDINEYMVSGTDAKDFKIKVQKDNLKLNSTKWYRKRFITYDEKTKKNINNLLNKLTEKNYRNITKEILRLQLNSYAMVNYLIQNIIEKCLLESQYILKWSFLIKHIVFNNLDKWTYNNIYIYQMFLDICQKNLEEILKSDHHNSLKKLYDSDIDKFYKKKNHGCSLMLLLAELYKLNLLNSKTIKSIIRELIICEDEYYKLELGIIIVNHLLPNKLGTELYKNNIEILLKNPKLNKKIKFMIFDIIEKNNNIKSVDNKKTELTYNDKKTELTYNDKKNELTSDNEIEVKVKNIINEYISEKDLNYTISCYNEIKVKPRSNKIIFEFLINLIEANDKKFNHVFGLIKNLIRRKNIKYNNIKFGLIDFFREYEDLILDYPNIDKSIIKILNDFVIIKVLDFNTIKFILNKGMKSDKYNYFITNIHFKTNKN